MAMLAVSVLNQSEHMQHAVAGQEDRCCPLTCQFEYTQDKNRNGWTDKRPMLYHFLIDAASTIKNNFCNACKTDVSHQCL